MKSALLIPMLWILSFAAVSQSNSDISAIGLVVSDINASETFYTNIIGMDPAGSFSLDTQWSKEAGAADNLPFSVKMFRMKGGEGTTKLKLAYFEKTKKRPKQSGVNDYAGVNYLTLNFSDLGPVLKRIEEAGIETLGWVKRENYQLVFIRDPDGVFVELVGPPEK